MPDVLETFERVARLPYPILLDSATHASEIARYSFVAANPRTLVRSKGREVTSQNRDTGTVVQETGRALDVIARHLSIRLAAPDVVDAADTGLPPFQGGAAGYIGYEYGGVLERLPTPHDDLAIADVVLGVYDWTIAWDHVTERCWIFAETQETLNDVAALIRDVPQRPPVQRPLPQQPVTHGASTLHEILSTVRSTFTQATYEQAVQRIREYIGAGDIFQANLSQRFSAPLQVSPWTLYRTLRAINPAPFAAYFETDDVTIASVSPERFLRTDATGYVETRPIKGTRPTSADAVQDATLRDELIHSTKDAAEHVMIVDVLRNDLSRVCEYGTVRVPTLLRHERHATVHHLVSTIVGQLRPEMTAIDLLHAAFPGGSITGAPKIRAMEIIAELEPVTRGVYCGAIGYISVTGAMDMSIAIRACIAHQGNVHCSAGGGIVADSDPTAEYDETLVKANALLRGIVVANDTADTNPSTHTGANITPTPVPHP